MPDSGFGDGQRQPTITSGDEAPMDFALNETHKMVEKTVYDFTRKEVLPIIKEHDRNHTYPLELVPKMAELGLHWACAFRFATGAGMDYILTGYRLRRA
ncbi:MAG: acyl-CoA dehydrogenase family protein [Chloroflexota bacterium]